MNTKQEAIDLIGKLQKENSTMESKAELYFKSKIEKGLQDIEEGKLLSQEEVEEKMSAWHGDIIQNRRETIEAGKAEFISNEKLKASRKVYPTNSFTS